MYYSKSTKKKATKAMRLQSGWGALFQMFHEHSNWKGVGGRALALLMSYLFDHPSS